MSHYTVLTTRISDPHYLAEAIADMGYQEVEVYDQPQPLLDFQGEERKQRAEVIVRRQHLGWVSNDLGFCRQHGGTMNAIISDYDRDKHNKGWMQELTRRYAYQAARGKLEEQGFDLAHEQRDAEGRIHLVLRRTV